MSSVLFVDHRCWSLLPAAVDTSIICITAAAGFLHVWCLHAAGWRTRYSETGGRLVTEQESFVHASNNNGNNSSIIKIAMMTAIRNDKTLATKIVVTVTRSVNDGNDDGIGMLVHFSIFSRALRFVAETFLIIKSVSVEIMCASAVNRFHFHISAHIFLPPA